MRIRKPKRKGTECIEYLADFCGNLTRLHININISIKNPHSIDYFFEGKLPKMKFIAIIPKKYISKRNIQALVFLDSPSGPSARQNFNLKAQNSHQLDSLQLDIYLLILSFVTTAHNYARS